MVIDLCNWVLENLQEMQWNRRLRLNVEERMTTCRSWLDELHSKFSRAQKNPPHSLQGGLKFFNKI
jgi:hypothetical protein